MKKKRFWFGASAFLASLVVFYVAIWTAFGFNTSLATLVGVVVLSLGLSVLLYAILSVLGFAPPLFETLKKIF